MNLCFVEKTFQTYVAFIGDGEGEQWNVYKLLTGQTKAKPKTVFPCSYSVAHSLRCFCLLLVATILSPGQVNTLIAAGFELVICILFLHPFIWQNYGITPLFVLAATFQTIFLVMGLGYEKELCTPQ